MTTLFNYRTPKRFAAQFHEQYTIDNLKQVQILSILFFVISLVIRGSYIIYPNSKHILNFPIYSNINWVQMGGTFLFLLCSWITLQYFPKKYVLKKVITLAFVLFLLTIALTVSYTFSMNNTKNNLMMYLIGITTVSLFFSLEFVEIVGICTLITSVYGLSVINADISTNDKIMNLFASLILGFVLYCFSRYSYFFKSQHFVRLKQLEEKNLEIERLLIQQGEILGFVAHDLRTPLNNIEALSHLLISEQPKDELRLIVNSTTQAKNIINDLIEAIKTDKSELDTQQLNLNSFLKSTIDRWKTNSKRNFVLQLAEPEINTHVNASKMERVLDNLISNAIKFSDDDKDIIVSLDKVAKKIMIKVKDKGIGIPKDLLPFVFNQFSQAGRPGLRGEKSLGLGLHISKEIMSQHGGQLLLSSEENEGTEFTALLPANR